jgi:hypothetical protein
VGHGVNIAFGIDVEVWVGCGVRDGISVLVGVEVATCSVDVGGIASGADEQAARKRKTIVSAPIFKEVVIQISFFHSLAPNGFALLAAGGEKSSETENCHSSEKRQKNAPSPSRLCTLCQALSP